MEEAVCTRWMTSPHRRSLWLSVSGKQNEFVRSRKRQDTRGATAWPDPALLLLLPTELVWSNQATARHSTWLCSCSYWRLRSCQRELCWQRNLRRLPTDNKKQFFITFILFVEQVAQVFSKWSQFVSGCVTDGAASLTSKAQNGRRPTSLQTFAIQMNAGGPTTSALLISVTKGSIIPRVRPPHLFPPKIKTMRSCARGLPIERKLVPWLTAVRNIETNVFAVSARVDPVALNSMNLI